MDSEIKIGLPQLQTQIQDYTNEMKSLIAMVVECEKFLIDNLVNFVWEYKVDTFHDEENGTYDVYLRWVCGNRNPENPKARMELLKGDIELITKKVANNKKDKKDALDEWRKAFRGTAYRLAKDNCFTMDLRICETESLRYGIKFLPLFMEKIVEQANENRKSSDMRPALDRWEAWE